MGLPIPIVWEYEFLGCGMGLGQESVRNRSGIGQDQIARSMSRNSWPKLQEGALGQSAARTMRVEAGVVQAVMERDGDWRGLCGCVAVWPCGRVAVWLCGRVAMSSAG